MKEIYKINRLNRCDRSDVAVFIFPFFYNEQTIESKVLSFGKIRFLMYD